MMKDDGKPYTYAEWEDMRLRGRGGKRKLRRDLTLAKQLDGALTFTYADKELLATLTPDNTYTLYRDKGYTYPTYTNLFRLICRVAVYNDMSHFKHYAQPLRINVGDFRWTQVDGEYVRVKSMPFTNGLQFRDGKCLNPEIAIDYNRKLDREKSLPWLRKTVDLAKVLRVATRMQLLERKSTDKKFEDINIENPTAEDAEIILCAGNAMGLYSWRFTTPEEKQAALMRCAENGLADYREWLYKKHGCFTMVPVTYTEGEQQ